jgi:hypothetical protein
VLGVALFVVVVFGVGSALSGGGSNGPPLRATPSHVKGTDLLAVPATSALRHITEAGDPPRNVADAVAVPDHARYVGATDIDQNASQFDRSVRFAVTASQQSVVTFYDVEMTRLGWHVTGPGPASDPGAIQLLGQRAGDDGWEWEMATVVEPSAFSGTLDTTPFSIELYQLPDQD